MSSGSSKQRHFWEECQYWKTLRQYLPERSARPEDYWDGKLEDAYRRYLLSAPPPDVISKSNSQLACWLDNQVWYVREDKRFWMKEHIPQTFLEERTLVILRKFNYISAAAVCEVPKILKSRRQTESKGETQPSTSSKYVRRRGTSSETPATRRSRSLEKSNRLSDTRPRSREKSAGKTDSRLRESWVPEKHSKCWERSKDLLGRKTSSGVSEKPLRLPLPRSCGPRKKSDFDVMLDSYREQVRKIVREGDSKGTSDRTCYYAQLAGEYGKPDIKTVESGTRCSAVLQIQGYTFEADAVNKERAIEESARRALVLATFLLEKK